MIDPDGILLIIYVMQCPRSYRFVLLLCFVICISIYNYRSNAIRIQLNFYFQTNILSKNIDQRLSDLKEHFKHVNISMLLYRPVSDQSPSITYRCREWCGGCSYKSKVFSFQYIRNRNFTFRGRSFAWYNINIYPSCSNSKKILY